MYLFSCPAPKLYLYLHPCYLPYPLEYNHGVVFFNMSFWVRFNSKNPSKRGLFDQKMGFYSRKSPKTGLLKRGEVIFKSGALLERIRYSNWDRWPKEIIQILVEILSVETILSPFQTIAIIPP